jgi:putative ABC transport system ATP-binding protein
VAIARALVNRPQLLLADEPTGNLDTDTGAQIIRLLKEMHVGGQTVVLVTHNPEVAVEAGRIYRMRDGHLTEITAKALVG